MTYERLGNGLNSVNVVHHLIYCGNHNVRCAWEANHLEVGHFC